ncbi:hypothetical protein B0H15DRAFT_168133 [Mycena belliarum]|uniref:Uncharacterized protein n=1 Tax=Mycena belliarum TaxID=1033014 RepID=A0AAD6XHH8_9AGAR|nr:hypothetical protein B0H15DRAFT_168133 [Mycena belliae]
MRPTTLLRDTALRPLPAFTAEPTAASARCHPSLKSSAALRSPAARTDFYLPQRRSRAWGKRALSRPRARCRRTLALASPVAAVAALSATALPAQLVPTTSCTLPYSVASRFPRVHGSALGLDPFPMRRSLRRACPHASEPRGRCRRHRVCPGAPARAPRPFSPRIRNSHRRPVRLSTAVLASVLTQTSLTPPIASYSGFVRASLSAPSVVRAMFSAPSSHRRSHLP